mmetsp:Transcript_615/g.820  ORF Transcript_615/g.820 Transcript_615/m.820 type:complete len:319 (+) Transcript_615:94-1050(+)|eukprot:CAMPEP_0172505898 /NCGR_PEP_ID=MMETSP1066-20121228/189779_1 /TAXON_ID=671091 /ORGANISM="Coscinodiscus wailesii, Strain CCMP2513" /LENGTH=318 /DNA_ID=CAMNT_0013282663 /DNA_START=83 /DNA_END=1039 /DNA_ORIENTATION=+
MVFFGRVPDENGTEMASSAVPTSAGQSTVTSTKETPLLNTTEHDDMVIVDSPTSRVRTSELQGNPAGGMGAAGTDDRNGIKMSSVGAAASFVNEQVGKVKRLATEGPLSFRVLAFLGGVAMIITSVLDWLGEIFRFSVLRALISVYTFIFGVFICILEGKMFVPDTAKYQLRVFSLAKFLKFVWGRGAFYFFAGSLQFSQMGFLNMASGGFMCFVGIISIITGWSTASKLKQVRESLANVTTVNDKFVKYDDDNDGYLDATNFAALVKDVGLELDHNELVAAFATIDKDDDEKISLQEFNNWWSSFQANTVREASLMV